VTQIDIQNLTLSGIAHRCAQESDRFFNRQAHDPGFCYELFRRAIQNRNQMAWERIYAQYQRLVTHWVERHAAFPSSGEEVQFFMNRAFEKMWLGISPEKFETFANLKSILKYLQMCVHSVMVDFVRQKEYKLVVESAENLTRQPHSGQTVVEDAIMDELDGRKLWRWLQDQLHDEREKCVVYGMFVLALKPGELLLQYPKIFTDVKDIYRVKENLLARLRRNDELRQFFDNA
jgi:DNA-directed RNA polymerase specialized sigma24 family protein